MASFSKFIRPKSPRRGVLTSGDLDALEIVLRFRFSPTSELVRLRGGNQDVMQRRLRMLWERELVNRFAFPKIPNHGEFIYYLDRRHSLELLVQHGRLSEIHSQMDDELRMNADADYAGAVIRGQHMKLGFLQHNLMISRMHFMLEMASRSAKGHVELAAWRQGAELRGNKVHLPALRSRRVDGTNDYAWDERDETIRLPVEPDAMFSLRFRGSQAEDRLLHFCYEADRGSMPMADMLKKFRAYYHFIKRQQKHKEAFGVHPIRAVLVETTSEARARKLMELAQHPAVVGASKRSGLFWFTISPLFAEPVASKSARTTPSYLDRPSIVLNPIWALPDQSLLSLGEAENSVRP